ncbi:MAG: hypothetical protein K8T25_03610 [Planctomycetia bacterium]|nr:hypothetical protein [Planctomycetia bacterium]
MRISTHLALCLACWCATAADSLAEGPAQKIDVTYIQPGFCAALVVHPRRMFDAPLVKMMPAKKVDQAILQWTAFLSGVSPRQIDEIEILVGPPAPETANAGLVSFGVVVRFSMAMDPNRKLVPAALNSQPSEFRGKKYSRSAETTPLGPLAFCFPDARTFVYADEKSLQQMLTTGGSKSPLVDLLASMYSNHDVLAAGVMAPLGPTVKNAVQNVQKRLLKPAPDELGSQPNSFVRVVNELLTWGATAPSQMKWAAMTFDLSGGHLLKLGVEGNDAAAGKDLSKHFEAALDFIKKSYGSERGKIEQGTPPEIRLSIMKLLDELVAGLSVTEDGNRVALSLKTPSGWAELPATLKPIVEKSGQAVVTGSAETGAISANAAVRAPIDPTTEPPLRTWTDVSGAHHIEARFLGVEGDKVRLRIKEGNVITIPLAKLSQPDQKYAKGAVPANRAMSAQELPAIPPFDLVVPGGRKPVRREYRAENSSVKTISDLEKLGVRVTLEVVSIDFGDTHISDQELARLKEFAQLKELRLGGTSVTDRGLAHLKELPKLQRLDLGGTQITDTGIFQLTALTQLTELSLAYTHATDGTLSRIKGLTQLANLNLTSTSITDSGLQHLGGLTSLKVLYLNKTRVTDGAVKRLRQALPNCAIYLGPNAPLSTNWYTRDDDAKASPSADRELDLRGIASPKLNDRQ